MVDDIPNIRHLAAFAATVRLGTVTAAADEIALTQPALTQAIARLELALDCRLFDREPGGMRPTEPALLLAPRAEVALRSEEHTSALQSLIRISYAVFCLQKKT